MEGDKFIKTKPRKLIENLDKIPFPAYDLVPDLTAYAPQVFNYRKLPVSNVFTSRGCPNQCTFCDRTVFGQRFRQRSPENVAKEISLLYHKYGIREFYFADDTFTLNFERVEKLFEILDKEDIHFPWTCQSRVSAVNEKMIKKMKELGCWMLCFGIESGDESILKTIKKNISLDSIRQAISWCKKAGLRSTGFFMIGHHGETIETMNKTIKFAQELPLSIATATINTPYPGSEQYLEVNKYGSLQSTDWTQFNHFRPVFVPFGLTQEIILKKQKEFYSGFYLRIKIIISFMTSFLHIGGFKRFLRLLRSVPYLLFK
jgi:radical SAM superfamily enzyme YgiQ (UPF0313 family)